MRIIKKFQKILEKSQQMKVILLVVMMIISAFLEVVGVTLIIPLMTALVDENCISKGGLVTDICRFLHIESHTALIVTCLLSLMAVYIIKDVYIIFETRVQYRFLFNQRLRTQKKILHVYLTRPYEFFLGTGYAEVTKVISSDVSEVFTLLTSLMTLTSESVVALFMVITVAIISPTMTFMVAAAMTICMMIIIFVVKPKMKKAGEDYRFHYTVYNRWLYQAFQGIKEMKITRTGEFFELMFDKSGQKTLDAQRSNQVWNLIPRLIIEMVSVCAALTAMVIMIISGMTMVELLPSITAFGMAAVKLLPSANRIVAAGNDIAMHEPALDSLIHELEALNRAEEVGTMVKEKEAECKITAENSVQLCDITYGYPNADRYVLEEANMEIPIGKSIGVVGTSGAGKSTAIDIMLGLLLPQSGKVRCDGVDIQDNYEGWLSHVGYIPQSIFLLDSDIRENVAFGIPRSEIDDDAVWKAVEQAQLGEFVRSLPEGIYSTVGEDGIRLSGGQRQRIGVARALYNDPEILVFDEATSALDNDTEAAIMESVNSFKGHKTMVIIAHRLTTIEECDMVYRVEGGKIVRER